MSQLVSLKNQKEFDAVNRSSTKHVGKFFILVVGSVESPFTLLGMKVGRKFGSSVVRNKFKRRIRAIVRECAKAASGRAFIVIPKSYATKSSFAELKHEFERFAIPSLYPPISAERGL